MKYQKIIKLTDKVVTLPSKFRTTNFVEINYDARRTYNTAQIVKLNLRMQC